MVNILGKGTYLRTRDRAAALAGRWRQASRPSIWPVNQGDGAPMTTFDDRKDAFEKKFAHDEELRFKATARRNKLLGLWAAQQLGKSGADAEAYAKSVVLADFQEAGDDDVLRKVKADLEANGASQEETELRRVMTDLMEKAIGEV